MAQWRKTINIKQFLHREGVTPKQVARDVANALRRSPAFVESGVIDNLDELPDDCTADDFDEVLIDVYDFADERRIWLGP